MARNRKKSPQPPIDPERHPTGVRTVWWPLGAVVVGVVMLVWGPGRMHDVVFGDRGQLVSEWRLTEAVTKRDVTRVKPTDQPPGTTTQADPGPVADGSDGTTPPAGKDQAPDVQNGDDFCET